MQESRPDTLELTLRAEHEARVARSYAPDGNRHERRAEIAMARRQRTAPVFTGDAARADVIAR